MNTHTARPSSRRNTSALTDALISHGDHLRPTRAAVATPSASSASTRRSGCAMASVAATSSSTTRRGARAARSLARAAHEKAIIASVRAKRRQAPDLQHRARPGARLARPPFGHVSSTRRRAAGLCSLSTLPPSLARSVGVRVGEITRNSAHPVRRGEPATRARGRSGRATVRSTRGSGATSGARDLSRAGPLPVKVR